MKRAIIGLARDEVTDRLESDGDGESWALEVQDGYSYLDGGDVVQHGMAAETLEESRTEVELEDHSVETLREDELELVSTEWIADLAGAGYACVDTSDGSFFWDMIAAQVGVRVDRAEIDVGGFVRDRRDLDPKPDWWMKARREGSEEDPSGVSIDYHGDVPQEVIDANIGIGFEYSYEGRLVSGVLYESGFVAMFGPEAWGTEHFARWLKDEVLPYAGVEDDAPGEQDTLDT
jgi:hypothetical protein